MSTKRDSIVMIFTTEFVHSDYRGFGLAGFRLASVYCSAVGVVLSNIKNLLHCATCIGKSLLQQNNIITLLVLQERRARRSLVCTLAT